FQRDVAKPGTHRKVFSDSGNSIGKVPVLCRYAGIRILMQVNNTDIGADTNLLWERACSQRHQHIHH
ncbi:hypothetical protein ACQKP7_06965, partial [Pseudomonas frederiksbergensis]|uniref:hypothetical protein n=1 Tax=Pseudomonas frederiksbergensis TaxID=104087 RepID=UPI003D084299